ncbi:MAG: hypothetical protein AVDCRST_MAG68-573 [uncultured Gemmatimonadetes bacterium]|uniref:Uncharacterized protein n=1 Tax=uncultured Gemmatimonadota bacterium TaxID=203437 RepID=A0A6J4KD12_9BACT|nr:MAG: hypothetical protein AVDCRST_MAG68-573 [uncultured Gemmatimonadota bacterium]
MNIINDLTAGPVGAFVAVFGVLALLARLGWALLRVGVTVAEETAAAGMAEASARRGDLTTLAERRDQAVALRRARWAQIGVSTLWAALLVAPPLLDVARPVYVAAILLWLLPRPPLRRRA